VRWRLVASRDVDAGELATYLGLPLIMKPRDGGGSRGVRLFERAGDLRAFLDDYPFQTPLLAEEYLDGPEISVEALSYRGRHRVVAVTEKTTTGSAGFIETGHIMPAELPPGIEEQAERTTVATLDAIGQWIGGTHTEIRLTSRGPRVVETHTRPGGDHIPALIALSYDVDVATETFRSVVSPDADLVRPAPRGFASSQFFLFPEGVVTGIAGFEEARAVPGVLELRLNFKRGDRLGPVRHSHDRHGYFLVARPTRAELLESIEAVRQALTVSVA
jgi:biotin carboxylase